MTRDTYLQLLFLIAAILILLFTALSFIRCVDSHGWDRVHICTDMRKDWSR